MDTLDYLNKLAEKIENKDLEVFWLMVDRDDFKPFKNYSDKELKNLFKKKIKYYEGKRIATIKIYVKNKQSCIDKNDSLVELVFGIFKIDYNGSLDDTGMSLLVKYYKDDLDIKKPALKDVQRFMKLCANNILGSSVIGGVKFTKLMTELKNKKIKF
jgi:hypothetical protein